MCIRDSDGGALGFLAWTALMLAGSLACMRIQYVGAAIAARQLVAVGACAMTIGYALSCLTNGGALAAPPLCEPWHPRDMWTMSQQAASASYVVFGAGFSLLAYAAFVQQADLRARELPLFRTLGCNALAGYVLHGLVEDFVRPYAPKDSPLWWALAMFAVFFAITWAMLRGLERQGLFVRL
jgi:predicted acyltransferase